MRSLLVAAALLLLLAGRAGAAGFDCHRATSPTEKRICADASLSKLDERMADAYATAIARSGDPSQVKADQLLWLRSRRDACTDSTCLRDAYAARRAELADETPAYESLPDAMDHACIALAARASTPASHCRITATAAFGKLDGETFRYALYCMDETHEPDSLCEAGGIALFASDASGTRVRRWHLGSDDSGNQYAAPRIVRSRDVILLDVPVSVPGTGAYNASELFVRAHARWRRVDNTSWEKDLARRLPKGLAAWKGIWPDLATLSATTGLYRAKDANCCPTGGEAKIRLALKGDRLVLDSLSVSR